MELIHYFKDFHRFFFMLLKKSLHHFVIALMALYPGVVGAQTMVDSKIDSLLKGREVVAGIAVLKDGEIIYSKNGDGRFPLMSVFKFHVALAVLDKMSAAKIPLDSMITVKAAQLPENTYSPLRDRFPGQDIVISLGELIRYSVSMSDNNACDILIGFAGGTTCINDFIRKQGIADFNISETEESMHRNPEALYSNWSTPGEVVKLMYIVETEHILPPLYENFLWETMLGTSTGADKLKGSLPPGARVGHKTGSSDRTPKGIKIADNDAGFVILPDGARYYIAVLLMHSNETDKVNAGIIADISRLIYDGMIHNKSN